ncbi:hypothetical protein [Robertmurraya sp. FSL R5-0851]|uniref:hypothetical protein n=1 Tax=Robertmurraya sp. FSL R5-0851 TaxID=2921584 RepID=UPI0030F972A2
MDLLTSLLQLPSLWMLVLGVIALIVVVKVIRSVVGAITGLVFAVIGLIRIYSFLSDKF